MAVPANDVSPATEMAVMHRMSLQNYDYLFDWAASMQISSTNPLEGEARGLRCFAVPKEFSMHTGIRGHYLINTNQNGAFEPLMAEVVSLPAFVEFLDAALPAALAISFKYAENKKVYVQYFKLPLMCSIDKETKKEIWQTDAKPILAKLETIASFAAVENRDGCALGKQVDKWLCKQALSFKAINLTSTLKCRDWCSTGHYSHNLKLMLSAAELSLRRAAKQGAGGRSVAQPTNTSVGCEQAKAVQLTELAPKLKILKEAGVQLLQTAPYYDVSLGSRLVHVELEPYEEGAIILLEGIEGILKRNSGTHAAALLEMIKKGDKIKLISQGIAQSMPFASPLVEKKSASRNDQDDDEPISPLSFEEACPKISPNSGVHDLDAELAEDELNEEDGEEEDEESGPQLVSKKQPARRSKRAKAAVTAAKAADVETGKPSAPEIVIEIPEEPPAKRPYRKTGMFSKNPETATLARAKHGKALMPPSTPSAATHSSAGSTKSTPLELAEIAKLKNQNFELKAELKVKESEIASLTTQLTAAVTDKVLAVSNKSSRASWN